MRYAIDPNVLSLYIENSGLNYTENSVSWVFTCPRCDKAKKLYIRKRDGRFVCWRCKETDNFQGRPEYALSELTGSSFSDVCRSLYGEIPLRNDPLFEARIEDFFLDEDDLDTDALPTIKWPHDFYPIEDEFYSKRGIEYLKSRGVSVSIAKQYD